MIPQAAVSLRDGLFLLARTERMAPVLSDAISFVDIMMCLCLTRMVVHGGVREARTTRGGVKLYRLPSFDS
jgi:hypothetical protein